jgi:TolA-binding protein
MTKDIQKLKKWLLMEELKRQGKAPKKRLWVFVGLALVALLATGGFWYQASLQARLEETWQEGLELRRQGEYADAVALFINYYNKHASHARASKALFQAAEMQDLYLGLYSDAMLTYLLLERDYPESEEVFPARMQIATLYKYRLNDCSQAIAVYQKILDQPGQEQDRLQYEVADCYFRLNNYEQARIEFESLVKNFPDSTLIAEVRYRIAITYTLEGLLPEAAGAYRLVLKDWAESPYALEARFSLATVLEEQEELLEALKILEDLVGVYPNEDVLERKTVQVRERIEKKKKAI